MFTLRDDEILMHEVHRTQCPFCDGALVILEDETRAAALMHGDPPCAHFEALEIDAFIAAATTEAELRAGPVDTTKV